MRKIIVALIITLFLAGCYYDSEESLFPSLPGTCDTTSVSYSTDIVPVLSGNCYVCHSNLSAASLGNNIFVENYADVKKNADRILGSISHDPGFSAMPKGGGTLSDCRVNTFKAWINQGMQDN